MGGDYIGGYLEDVIIHPSLKFHDGLIDSGRVTRIFASNLISICSDNGLSPGQRTVVI